MKGTIEISQGAVLYILLMLAVVFIGLMIVTKGQLTILFEQKKFSSLFEPGVIGACVPSDNDRTCKDVSTENIRIDSSECIRTIRSGRSDAYASYNVILEGVNFYYRDAGNKAGNSLDFVVILDFQDNVVIGRNENGVINIMSCTKDGDKEEYYCGQKKTLYFPLSITSVYYEIGGVRPGTKEFMHFTIWRSNIVPIITGSTTPMSFTQILDSYSHYYLGSFDVGGPVNLLKECMEYLCGGPNLLSDINDCHLRDLGCWYDPGFFGVFASCNACDEKWCINYKHEYECRRCGDYYNTPCSWSAEKSECSPSFMTAH